AAIAERWDGTTWAVQSVPAPGGALSSRLESVACPSTVWCAAVGSYTNDPAAYPVVLAAIWNGTAWGVQPITYPSPSQTSDLSGIACTSTAACTAVGYYVNSSDARVTLAETWNGTAWSFQSSANPGGAGSSELSGVACITSALCVAVGDYEQSIGSQVTL